MKYQTTFNIAWQHETVNDFIFIRHYARKDFLMLEDVAKDFWLAIVNGQPFEALLERLATQYEGMEKEDVEKDYQEFIADCLQRGLIEVDNEIG